MSIFYKEIKVDGEPYQIALRTKTIQYYEELGEFQEKFENWAKDLKKWKDKLNETLIFIHCSEKKIQFFEIKNENDFLELQKTLSKILENKIKIGEKDLSIISKCLNEIEKLSKKEKELIKEKFKILICEKKDLKLLEILPLFKDESEIISIQEIIILLENDSEKSKKKTSFFREAIKKIKLG